MANFYQPQNGDTELTAVQAGSRIPVYKMQQGMKETDPALYKFPENDPQYFKPKRHRHWLKYLFNCRCLGMGCAIVLVLAVLFFAWVLASRPPAIVNPAKDWLNVDLIADSSEPLNIEEVNTDLSTQVAGFVVGENTLHISEEQLRALLDSKIQSDAVTDIYAHIEEGKIKIFWDIDVEPEHPLWVVVELTPSGDGTSASVTKIGTERIAVPSFLNSIAEGMVLSLLNVTGSSTGNGLIGLLLPFPDNVQVTGMEVVRGELNIKLKVSTGLESLFQ
ncbi:hypothetical protein KC640_02805 [Candidatus Dojkabacteria bacterium]|uniref:Uncharacterized protein n=1 Tax=Candidatus Dojkabacteria bacterium TaxID=2099670 RepID=A0A955ID89_9BACT|nr:hypothetical protein [Candidatus Dojkabacteria bacterium]